MSAAFGLSLSVLLLFAEKRNKKGVFKILSDFWMQLSS